MVNHRSQRIEAFSVEANIDGSWRVLDEQTTVGRKRLLRLSSLVTTDLVRITIKDSRLEPTLAAIGLFKQAHLPKTPIVSDRDAEGCVLITSPEGLEVVFTRDGSLPSAASIKYASPIPLPDGGLITAACIFPNGSLGPAAIKRLSGLAPIGWRVVSVDGQEPDSDPSAICAIDEDPTTMWRPSSRPGPHSIAVDMERMVAVGGLIYAPRTDGQLSGVVQEYSFETSTDAANWTLNIDHGRFANIRNNPIPQEVPFLPVLARYFRFTAHRDALGGSDAGATKISVLAASPDGQMPSR